MRIRKYAIIACILAGTLLVNGCAVGDLMRDLLTTNALESVPEDRAVVEEQGNDEQTIDEQEVEELQLEQSEISSSIEMEPPIIVVQESDQNPEDQVCCNEK